MTDSCQEMVWDASSWYRHRCTRKAKADGYCAQHHPDAKKARQEASSERWRQQMEAQRQQNIAAAKALLTREGYRISGGPEK